jgi:hypothetical protein
MCYLFDRESLEQCRSQISAAQLRRDFDYPAGAFEPELVQLEHDGPMGPFFELTMLWQERRVEWRYDRYRHEWEQTEVWKPFQRKLEPRYERYL